MSKTIIICSDGATTYTYDEKDTKIELIGLNDAAYDFYYQNYGNAKYLVEEVIFEDDSSGVGMGSIDFKTNAGNPLPLKGRITGARTYVAVQPIGAAFGIADVNKLAVQAPYRPADVGWDLSNNPFTTGLKLRVRIKNAP